MHEVGGCVNAGAARGIAGFAARFPRVWHVMEAEGDGCEILYPAATLRALASLAADSANRDDFQRLALPDGGQAILRMQLMRDARLLPSLAGTFSGRPDLWRGHLNRHVFFWLAEDRRDRFVNACVRLRAGGAVGRGSVHAPLVIELDTARLLAAHRDAAFFSVINTGSTLRGGGRARRDENSLRPVDAWHGERAVELAIREPVSHRRFHHDLHRGLHRGPVTEQRYSCSSSASCNSATTRQSSSASTK